MVLRIMNDKWDCVVITCPTLSSAIAVDKEIKFLQAKNRLTDVPVLTIEDPGKNIGSGAATLNALLVATEYLSALKNYTVVTGDVLHEARILILHNGRNYIYSSCSGKAFISLPQEWSVDHYQEKKENFCAGVIINLESVLLLIDELSKNSPFGVWVCSTDMMILKGEKDLSMSWNNVADVVMFCISSVIEYATGHGVIGIDELGHVADIVYCGSTDRVKKYMNSNGTVPLVSGIVYLSSRVAESLLSLHAQSPLDSCTYLGLDSGADPIQVSLFFDILVAMSTDITEDEFVSGRCGKIYNLKAGFTEKNFKRNLLARSLVWKELSNYNMTPKMFDGCQHIYWSNQHTAQNHINNMFQISSSGLFHSILKEKNSEKHLVINSIIEDKKSTQIADGTVICDCELSYSGLNIGKNCILSGVTIGNTEMNLLTVPDNTVVLNCHVKYPDDYSFVSIFGTNDDLMIPLNSPNSTFCNKPWFHLLKRLSIDENDIWSKNLDEGERNLLNAELFPCQWTFQDNSFLLTEEILNEDILNKWKKSLKFSLAHALNHCDYSKGFDQKRNIYAQISSKKISDVLRNNEDVYLLPYFRTACAEGYHLSIIDTLDSILLTETGTAILTRTLSCMADVLSMITGKSGGLRSGPGANKAWICAFNLLLNGNILEGMKALQEERVNWLDKPDHLIRAARHYERAAQILIQNAVKTVTKNINLRLTKMTDYDVYVTADCPVRIDLQGGWTDTPPICYELGGSVINIAVVTEGKPVGAAACRTREPRILLKLGRDNMCSEILIKKVDDILDFDKPSAPGALLKAALICAEIININSNVSLKEQLLDKFGGGFVVQSWSLLPQGCGMGTSSILAGAIISVLWSVSGKVFDKLSVVHAVLHIEQLLTTGGGWQDQLSGVIGGVNRGYSDTQLPLSVHFEPLSLAPELVKKLNSQLLLIYTGKVRLAKNILQNVVRNWYAREETIVSCFRDLISHSLEMKKALLEGDFEQVGFLMDKYWQQKKLLAPGCEPAIVREMMNKLEPLCHGQVLVGAGGGGYMCVLTKEPNMLKKVEEVLCSVKTPQTIKVYAVTVHLEGLEICTQSPHLEKQ